MADCLASPSGDPLMTSDYSPLGGALSVDQYQLTMAQVYWKEGLADRTAQFDYFFRSYPDYGTHQAGYCVMAGLGWLLDWMEVERFGTGDLQVLAEQRTSAGEPRFDKGFLAWLAANGTFERVQMSAIGDGRVVHANVPLATVTAPLPVAQILETSLLNHLNYPTLIATKASRVKEASRGRPILEFGLRRGPHSGADAGTLAALVGGADYSSNVGLATLVGSDPKGTHAHSLVQAFMALGMGEREAFSKFAEAYPDDCVLLVDTIDVLESGVPNAIAVFDDLVAAGHSPAGIRIDSGDLAYLAIRSAALLDAAGHGQVPIVLSSDLDELVIWQILSQIEEEAGSYGLNASALIDRLVLGVGTRLITSHGDSSLGGVYKLVGIADQAGDLSPAIKVSEDSNKVPTPGDKRVLRFYDQRGLATADVIAMSGEDISEADEVDLFHPHRDVHRRLTAREISSVEDLHANVFSDGRRIDGAPSLEEARSRRENDLLRLDPGVRRLVNPHVYHVSLTARLKKLQRSLVDEATGNGPS